MPNDWGLNIFIEPLSDQAHLLFAHAIDLTQQFNQSIVKVHFLCIFLEGLQILE